VPLDDAEAEGGRGGGGRSGGYSVGKGSGGTTSVPSVPRAAIPLTKPAPFTGRATGYRSTSNFLDSYIRWHNINTLVRVLFPRHNVSAQGHMSATEIKEISADQKFELDVAPVDEITQKIKDGETLSNDDTKQVLSLFSKLIEFEGGKPDATELRKDLDHIIEAKDATAVASMYKQYAKGRLIENAILIELKKGGSDAAQTIIKELTPEQLSHLARRNPSIPEFQPRGGDVSSPSTTGTSPSHDR
jgi:hypothetical protein